MGANCRGIVTSDVLVKGLSCGAIATRKLEGVNWDKGHERFILVRPLTVKVRPTSSWVGIDVFDHQGARYAMPGSRRVVSYPKPPAGRPLIYMGRCPAAYRVPAGS